MNIGAANCSAINLYQYIVMANTRRLNLFQPDSAFGLGFDLFARELLRPGGLMAVDNVLWDGAVANSLDQSADTCAIRELNDTMGRDERVSVALVPIGDGLTLARKR